MSSKIKTEFSPREGTPQQQQHKDQKIAPGSRRYDLRTSRKNEIEQNVSQKRKVANTRRTPVNKRLKAGNPCDHPLRSIVSAEVGIAERDPRSLVDRSIEVYWPMEGVWYSGKVVRYDGYNKLHLVAYADGDQEWVSLQRDKVRLLEASATPTSSNKRNSEHDSTEETTTKHSVVEKSGARIKAVQRTNVIAYGRKRKAVNNSKQDHSDKEKYGDIEQGKRGHTNDIIGDSVIGDADREQKDSSGSLKGRSKRYNLIKKNLKQVDDLQMDDVGVGVVSDLLHKGGINEMRTTDDVSEGVVNCSCAEQGSFDIPKADIKSKPVTRFTYQRRRQRISVALSSGRDEVGNSDAVLHQRPVDGDSKIPNACEWRELLNLDEALYIHMSPLSLRWPSYWQCVAPVMQLCKRGNLEMVKSQSLEDLIIVLGSILHLFSAIDKKSSSYPLMEHFRARIPNSSESGSIMALLESLKPMATFSDIGVQVCVVGNMSSVRQHHFRKSFQEVCNNFTEHGVSVMGNGSMRTAKLHAALESFSVGSTSLKAGLCCPSACNSDNIHRVPNAEDNDLRFMSKAQHLSDSSVGSTVNDGSLALFPVEGLVNYARDTDIINVSQLSTKNIYLNSPSGSLDHNENIYGGFHAIQSLQISYASAPSLFTNLHQRLLVVRNSYNQLSLQSLPKRLPTSTISRFPRTKRVYTRILVRSECNNPLVGKTWSVQAYSPLVSSSKNDCKDNRHYALPVLRFQKVSTNFGKWCCELNSPLGHDHSAYGGTTKRIHKKLKDPNGFCRIAAPSELSGNVNPVPFRSTRSARPGRPARQCRKENRSEKLNGSVMDFSKPGSELVSFSCTTNILIVRVDRGWRESDAEVTLSPYTNEWTLDVKLHGFTRFTYKPQEAKISKMQEERITKVPGQVHSRSKSHTTIWKSGGDWSLEFPNKHQWFVFKKMYKECYERNNGSFSLKHKDIPLPGVYLVDNDSNLNNDIVPFVRPLHYIKSTEDEVRKAISSTHVLYDMDSEDERWLCQFNSNASDNVSDETFERIINELEKIVFVTQPDLTFNDAVEFLSYLVPVEVLRSIYSHWEEKRNKKGTALVRQFQMGMSRQTLSKNGSVQSSKGKERSAKGKQRPVIGQPSNRARNHGIGMQHRQQQQKANAIPFGNESSSHSLGLLQLQKQQEVVNITHFVNKPSSGTSGPTYIDAGLQKDKREIDAYLKSKREICVVAQKRVHSAALQKERENKMENDITNIEAHLEGLREICRVKRKRVQRLTQNFDLKTYIAGKAVRNAEIEKTRPLRLGGSAVAQELSPDGRENANPATRECSMGSSYWALVTNGH